MTENNNTTQLQEKPRGIPKSGRRWKPVKTERFSSLKKDKPLRTTWERKMELKAEKNAVKQYERSLIEKRKEEKREYRKRVEAHKKIKAENERRSEIVQIITNSSKIKKMKKRHLRQIEMRDTSGVKTRRM